MQTLTPNVSDYSRIAEIFNQSLLPFLKIYTSEERAAFTLLENHNSILEMTASRTLLAIRLGQAIVGYAAFSKKNDVCLWISGIYISPDVQQRGLGSFLLEKIELIAKESNCEVIALETHQKATWAINFYTKNGYRDVKEQLCEYPYNKVLSNSPIENRPLLAKSLVTSRVRRKYL